MPIHVRKPAPLWTQATPVAAALLTLLGTTTLSAEARAQESGESRLALHGYGEVHYNNPEIGTMDDGAPARADVHRFVLGWTYEFTPTLRLDAEVDYEHAARALELEYAHLDFDLTTTLTARAGSLLMPIGPLNEFHEPPTYYSVERPYVQQHVIPTTWQENGLGLVGLAAGGALHFRAYVVAGLDALGFSTMSGIRGGRSGSSESKAEDLAGVGRLEYASTAGLSIGASGYYGGADHEDAAFAGSDVTVGIGEADARFRRGGLDLRAVFAQVFVEGAGVVSLATTENVGEEMQGYYGEAAFDLLRRDRSPERRRALFLFGRYEHFDTNQSVSDSMTPDPAAERTVISGGVAFMPMEKVSLKADFEHWEDDTDDEVDRFNLGLAFEF